MEAETLLPCPFCGGDARLLFRADESVFGVECTTCDIAMLGTITQWNCRDVTQIREAFRQGAQWHADPRTRMEIATEEALRRWPEGGR